MTEFVQLPIFDENGMQTRKMLVVEVEALKATCGFRARVEDFRSYEEQIAAEEVENLERIVSGLEPLEITHRIVRDVGLVREHEGGVELVDFSVAHPPIEWRHIPEFTDYKMNSLREIVDFNDQEVFIRNADKSKERQSVILWDGERNVHMNLSHLFYKTFPELKK